MKPTPNLGIERFRAFHPVLGRSEPGENWGYFVVGNLRVIASDGLGWDHVSVSCPNRCPTWAEMCKVKQLWFSDDETVVQFHPKASEYVNECSTCLHLWRKQGEEYELPPKSTLA